MDDSLAKKMVEKAFTERDSSRLQALDTRFEKAVQTHDARLAASTAVLAAFSEISLPVHPISNTLACNAPALRHEHTVALPLAKP